MRPDLLRFTTVGSVDDGKSTLIGRLLSDLHAVYDDQVEALRRVSGKNIDLALITDGLRAEREQGITIDVAYRHFSTPRRRFIIADTPGHEQYTRNMVSGASTASVAVILVDVLNGVLPQTLRHAFLSRLLGIRHLCVAVNKMDAAGFREEAFESVRRALESFAGRLHGCEMVFIPVSALEGDNVVEAGDRMKWYSGPTLLEYLETADAGTEDRSPWFRFPVQYVIRAEDGYRAYAGRVAGGAVKSGDELIALPSGKSVCVSSVESPDPEVGVASSRMSVALRFADHTDVSRGDMLADPRHPPSAARSITAVLVWMSETPLETGRPYLLKHTTQRVCAEVTRQIDSLDIQTLQYVEPQPMLLNGIGRVLIETQRPIFCDAYEENRATGEFILIDPLSNRTLAAGLIESTEASIPDPASPAANHSGMAIWLTGLSSAGKSTLAQRVFEELRALGCKVEMLDGDTVRKHLCKDLGFSKEDRDENIRRIGFVAELLARNGVIAVVAAISPYRAIRNEIRRRVPNFVEVYVNAPLDVCEQRDMKGLYRRARAGELRAFTGIDDPYEPPLNPEVECLTGIEAVEDSVRKILRHVLARMER